MEALPVATWQDELLVSGGALSRRWQQRQPEGTGVEGVEEGYLVTQIFHNDLVKRCYLAV